MGRYWIQPGYNEWKTLKWTARAQNKPLTVRKRARILISASTGKSYPKIAKTHRCSLRTIGQLCRRFAKNRLDVLKDKPNRGRKFKSAQRVLAIVRSLRVRSRGSVEQLVARRLRGVDIRAIRRFLRKPGSKAGMLAASFEYKREVYQNKRNKE